MRVIYENSKSEYNKRHNYEAAMTRQEFSIEPITDKELKAWKYYINYIESNNKNEDDIIENYERCLNVCFYYINFWELYIKYLYKNNNLEKCEKILNRGIECVLKYIPSYTVLYCNYMELLKKYDIVRNIYHNAINISEKEYLEIIINYALFEKRNNGDEQFFEIIKCYIEGNKGLLEDDKIYLIEYLSRYFINKNEFNLKLKSIFDKLLIEYPLNEKLLIQLLIYTCKTESKPLDKCINYINQFKSSNGIVSDEILQIYCELCDDYGDNIEDIIEKKELINTYNNNNNTSKKRKIDDDYNQSNKQIAINQQSYPQYQQQSSYYQQYYQNYYQYYPQQYSYHPS